MPEGERSGRLRDVMTFGGGVKTFDGFGDDDQGGVKTKSDFASVKIVVDGFGDADDVDRFKEIARDVLRTIATADDPHIYPHTEYRQVRRMHKLAEVTQDTREEVESEEDSE
jgi:hypothetical protein